MRLRTLFVAAALALGTASAASAASAQLPSPDSLITEATSVDYMRHGWRRHHGRHYGWRHHRRHYGWHRGRHYGWRHHRRGWGYRHHRRWGGYYGGGYGYPRAASYGYAPRYYSAPVVTGSVGPGPRGNPGRHLGWNKHGGGGEGRGHGHGHGHD
jgi:hypothetical protein